ncbi:hypothetical protein CEXT_412541 [Caerostris extrusa]|uniref:Transmembrane protein n=1 Tax=Caerostris extrusa TaxID=172846 RepID=A0AAV4U8D4_CAEEX|nr:hypothetical protein CEXT_412541 [Caerostris extrusa]
MTGLVYRVPFLGLFGPYNTLIFLPMFHYHDICGLAEVRFNKARFLGLHATPPYINLSLLYIMLFSRGWSFQLHPLSFTFLFLFLTSPSIELISTSMLMSLSTFVVVVLMQLAMQRQLIFMP